MIFCIVRDYIGRENYFFPGKIPKICSRSNLIFTGLTFESCSNPLLKGSKTLHYREFRVSVSKSGFYFFEFQRNKQIASWSRFI